jgi:hypothetical protein
MKKAEQYTISVGDFVEKLLARQQEFERTITARQQAFEESCMIGMRDIVQSFEKQMSALNTKAAELTAELMAAFEAAVLSRRPHGGKSVN